MGHLTASRDQFDEASKIVKRKLAGGLLDAQMNSCAIAQEEFLAAITHEIQNRAIQDGLRRWRETSVSVLRDCAPEIYKVAIAFQRHISKPPLDWTQERLIAAVNARLRAADTGAVRFW